MPTKDDRDNRADQMNRNNDAYWQSRGLDERPDDWDENANDHKETTEDDKEAKPK